MCVCSIDAYFCNSQRLLVMPVYMFVDFNWT